ncbi:MAG: hypothetical protein ACR2LY_06820 [Thermoleophilaceae bacterium]
MAEERRTPTQEAKRLFEQVESQTAQAMEQLVGREGFGELLGRMTENAMALTRMGQGMLDMGVRNLRVAGREDVVRLARQLARTEDKLERVLQEVERLEQKLDAQTSELGGLFERSGSGGGSSASAKGSGSSSAKRSSSNGRSGGRRASRSSS